MMIMLLMMLIMITWTTSITVAVNASYDDFIMSMKQALTQNSREVHVIADFCTVESSQLTSTLLSFKEGLLSECGFVVHEVHCDNNPDTSPHTIKEQIPKMDHQNQSSNGDTIERILRLHRDKICIVISDASPWSHLNEGNRMPLFWLMTDLTTSNEVISTSNPLSQSPIAVFHMMSDWGGRPREEILRNERPSPQHTVDVAALYLHPPSGSHSRTVVPGDEIEDVFDEIQPAAVTSSCTDTPPGPSTGRSHLQRPKLKRATRPAMVRLTGRELAQLNRMERMTYRMELYIDTLSRRADHMKDIADHCVSVTLPQTADALVQYVHDLLDRLTAAMTRMKERSVDWAKTTVQAGRDRIHRLYVLVERDLAAFLCHTLPQFLLVTLPNLVTQTLPSLIHSSMQEMSGLIKRCVDLIGLGIDASWTFLIHLKKSSVTFLTTVCKAMQRFLIETIPQALVAFVRCIKRGLTKSWNHTVAYVRDVVLPFLKSMAESMVNFTRNLQHQLNNAAGFVIDIVLHKKMAMLQAVVNTITQIIGRIVTGFNAVLGGLAHTCSWISLKLGNVCNAIFQDLTTLSAAVSELVKDVYRYLCERLPQWINAARTAVQSLITAVQGLPAYFSKNVPLWWRHLCCRLTAFLHQLDKFASAFVGVFFSCFNGLLNSLKYIWPRLLDVLLATLRGIGWLILKLFEGSGFVMKLLLGAIGRFGLRLFYALLAIPEMTKRCAHALLTIIRAAPAAVCYVIGIMMASAVDFGVSVIEDGRVVIGAFAQWISRVLTSMAALAIQFRISVATCLETVVLVPFAMIYVLCGGGGGKAGPHHQRHSQDDDADPKRSYPTSPLPPSHLPNLTPSRIRRRPVQAWSSAASGSG